MNKISSKLKLILPFLTIFIFSIPVFAKSQPHIQLSTDKKEYIAGESLNIILKTDINCNVVLIYVTAAGGAVRILPSGTDLSGNVKSKKTYKTPATGEDRGLYIAAPFGKETIIAYATAAPLPEIPGKEIGPGLYLVPGGEQQLDKLLPDASKSIWELETFPKDERGRFRKSKPEDPIHMTGSAGQTKDIKDEGLK